jgi:hypothetical protein
MKEAYFVGTSLPPVDQFAQRELQVAIAQHVLIANEHGQYRRQPAAPVDAQPDRLDRVVQVDERLAGVVSPGKTWPVRSRFVNASDLVAMRIDSQSSV